MLQKSVFSLLVISLFALVGRAQTALITQPNGDVVYKQTFKVNGSQSDEQIYSLVQQWFEGSTDKFTRQNANQPEAPSNTKNKQAVDEAFNNSVPLQSFDPESRRISARGLTRYYGGGSSCINMLYLEYYVIVQVSNKEVTATVCNIRYHHFNRKSYAAQPIYSWMGAKPCDAADKLERLLSGSVCTDDLTALCSFLGQDMADLLADLKANLKTKGLTES